MIEFTAAYAGYTVTTQSNGIWFTVYHGEEIAGTIKRPGTYDRAKRWQAYSTDGVMIGTAIGPRTALMHFTR